LFTIGGNPVGRAARTEEAQAVRCLPLRAAARDDCRGSRSGVAVRSHVVSDGHRPATHGEAGTIAVTPAEPGSCTLTIHVTSFGASTPSASRIYSITAGR
jgi:hypothetical protein